MGSRGFRYFFRRPEIQQARQISATQITYVRLLSAISKAEVDFTEIEDLVKREPALCYRLLRYLNSPLLGLPAPVLSISACAEPAGERESVRWLRMATTLVMGQEKVFRPGSVVAGAGSILRVGCTPGRTRRNRFCS